MQPKPWVSNSIYFTMKAKKVYAMNNERILLQFLKNDIFTAIKNETKRGRSYNARNIRNVQRQSMSSCGMDGLVEYSLLTELRT